MNRVLRYKKHPHLPLPYCKPPTWRCDKNRYYNLQSSNVRIIAKETLKQHSPGLKVFDRSFSRSCSVSKSFTSFTRGAKICHLWKFIRQSTGPSQVNKGPLFFAFYLYCSISQINLSCNYFFVFFFRRNQENEKKISQLNEKVNSLMQQNEGLKGKWRVLCLHFLWFNHSDIIFTIFLCLNIRY